MVVTEVCEAEKLGHFRASLGCGLPRVDEVPLENVGLVMEPEPAREFVIRLRSGKTREFALYAERNPETKPHALHTIYIAPA
jgi:hypothetical protein